MRDQLLSLANHLARLTLVAGRAWISTAFFAVVAGITFALLAMVALHAHHWGWRSLAGVLALGECLAVGFAFAWRRAVTTALAEAFGALKLGGAVVRILFARMLSLSTSAAESTEARGNAVAQRIEKVPVARAEELLQRAIVSVLGEPEQGGWLRRKLKAMLFETVRKYTLARFRTEGENGGQLDLAKVGRELENTVDDLIVARILDGLFIWNLGIFIGVPALIVLQTLVIAFVSRAAV